LTGFSAPGAYACLSENSGESWKIRRLPGGQTRGDDGKSVDFRTVGYVGASQAGNGVIHLVTSRNRPDLHVELNEAWLLADDRDAEEAAQTNCTEVAPETLRRYEEFYPDGKPKAKWTGGVNSQGLYLLQGEQTFLYPDGQLQWRVTFENGLKMGRESYYRPDGTVQWQCEHKDKGGSEWTVFDDSGRKKAVSQWKDKKLLGYEVF
jgi:hypothetical protein